MSHVTKINLLITDLDALEKACGRLGLELMRGQKTMKSYQRGLKCDHAIRVKGNTEAYEIGLVKGPKGYELKWDSFFGGYGLVEKVAYGLVDQYGANANANKLKDWYAAEVAQKQMRKQGFRVNAYQRERKVEVLCSK